jgi:hypothetical protein
MNIQSLVVVVLRLMALDFLYRLILQSVSSLIELAQKSYSFRLSGGEFNVWMVFPMTVFGALLLAAILLWIFAPAVARLVSRGVSQDISLGALTLADCYSVAFMGVGLMYIAREVPAAITWAHYLLRNGGFGHHGYMEATGELVRRRTSGARPDGRDRFFY